MRSLSRPVRFLLFIPLFALVILVTGEVMMLLWNNVLTPVLHVSPVSFWQGLGILLLSKILFSSFSGRGRYRRNYWKQRMMWNNMTPEQKEKLRQEWKNRSRGCGYRGGEAEAGFEQPGTGL